MAMLQIRVPTSGVLTSDANGNIAGSSFENGMFKIQKVVITSTDIGTNGSVWVNATNVSGEIICLKKGISVGPNNLYPRVKMIDTDGSTQNQWENPLCFDRLFVTGSGWGSGKKGYVQIYAEEWS